MLSLTEHRLPGAAGRGEGDSTDRGSRHLPHVPLSQLSEGILTGLDQRFTLVYSQHIAGYCTPYTLGFMQDQIIASHTCFGGHVVVNR